WRRHSRCVVLLAVRPYTWSLPTTLWAIGNLNYVGATRYADNREYRWKPVDYGAFVSHICAGVMGVLFKAIKANIQARRHVLSQGQRSSKAFTGWWVLNVYANSYGVSHTALHVPQGSVDIPSPQSLTLVMQYAT